MLHKNFRAVTEWFCDNYIALNPTKCHYMCLGKNSNNYKFAFDSVCLENTNEKVIPGITLHNKLTFDSQLKIYVKKLVENFVYNRQYQMISKHA